MKVSIKLADTTDGNELEIQNVDVDDEVLLTIHGFIPNDDKSCVQVKIEDLKLALRKMTAK